MPSYWFGVLVDHVPDHFQEGFVLAEGMDDNAEIESQSLEYLILARARAATRTEAESLVTKAVNDMDPQKCIFITDQGVVRSERRLAQSMQDRDVSIRSAFIGVLRGSQRAQEMAIRILQQAVCKQWWQFWK